MLSATCIAEQISLILTHGQSLSVGGSSPAQKDLPHISTTPTYPNNVLAADREAEGRNLRPQVSPGGLDYKIGDLKGIVPLIEEAPSNVTHQTSMLNTIYKRHLDAGQANKKFLALPSGSGGRSVIELMIKPGEVFSSTSQALSTVAHGYPFAIDRGVDELPRFGYYYNNNGEAFHVRDRDSSDPVYFENMIEQVLDVKNFLANKGDTIDPEIVFVWIQGQGDTSLGAQTPDYQYDHFLELMVTRLGEELNQRLGFPVQIKAVINQIAGYSEAIPLAQFRAVTSNSNYYLGAQEHWLTLVHTGERTTTGHNTHLSKVGYTLMGERLGNVIADMKLGLNPQPLLVVNPQFIGTKLRVNIANLKGHLVEDKDYFLNAFEGEIALTQTPPNFGFRFYSDADNINSDSTSVPVIVSSKIIGSDTVEFTLDRVISKTFRLYLGWNKDADWHPTYSSRSGGTTLRDSFVRPLNTTSEDYDLSDDAGYDFIAKQYVLVGTGNAVEEFTEPTPNTVTPEAPLNLRLAQ